MKKLLFAAAAAALTFTSCTDLPSNGNGKAPETVPAGALFANATMNYYDLASVQNVNTNNLRLWAQHWTQTTYVDESNFALNERDVNGNTYYYIYTALLRDCAEARAAVQADGNIGAAELANAEATIDVMEVLGYMYLVDLFGDVPYSEALDASTNVPAYDNDADIYANLMERLDAAATTLASGGSNSFGSSDIVYGGDAAAWAKAANSLLLRMAVRIADVDATNAKMYGETAISNGVFTSSADDMRLQYSSEPPHTHPMWVTLVQSGRTDYIASSTLGDVMNAFADPRRAGFFNALGGSDSVIGAAHGYQSDYYQHSQPGSYWEAAAGSHAAVDYTEVEFLLAHAAVEGWTGAGDAGTHYDAAVTASIEYWGGTSADATTYLAQAGVAWDATDYENLIGTQKWIAMHTNVAEAYNTIRQYNVPTAVAALAGTETPTRWTYPLDEYSLNSASVAAANGGSDDSFDLVFWDAN